MAEPRDDSRRPSIIERKLRDAGFDLGEGRLLTRHTPISATTVHGRFALLLGLPFVAMGVFIPLVAFGVISAKSSSRAPEWVGAAAGSIFGVAGLWLVIHGLRGVFRQRWTARMRLRYGSDPWRSDYKWDERGARDMQQRGIGQMLFGVFFMVLFVAPFNYVAYKGLQEGSKIGLVFGCSNLLIPVYLIAFFYRLARWMKYGTGEVRFRRYPFFTGETLKLDYIPARRLPPIRKLTCVLRCIRESYIAMQSQGNSSSQVVCTALHEQTVEITDELAHASHDRSIPIAFELPADAPATCLAEMPPTYWQLEISAETPGVNLDSRFLLPVYARSGPVPKRNPDDGAAKAADQLKARLVEAVAAQR